MERALQAEDRAVKLDTASRFALTYLESVRKIRCGSCQTVITFNPVNTINQLKVAIDG